MLHRLHRLSALVIGSFAAVHILNHLMALQSIDAHIAFMESFRHVYRFLPVEILLLTCAMFQVGSGIYFIKTRWSERHGFFDRAQALSGGYLGYFLLVHIGAVLSGRLLFKLDTNFYYAAAGMHVHPFQYYFVPYYFLAVVAIFVHVSCAVHWLTRERYDNLVRDRLAYGVIAIGVVTASFIIVAFAGGFYPVNVPQIYRATYGA